MSEILQIVLYSLGSILLIVLIILGVKLIITMNKIENVVDNVNTKIDSLNGFFSIIDFTTDKLAMIGDKLVDGIVSLIRKIFHKKEEEENIDE